MTINELESKLQKLDPNLEIVRDRYMKSEVLVIKPDLLAVKGQYFIYDFSNKRFIRNGLLEWLNNNDTFAFDKMQSLLNRYWYGSKETQKISKDSKNENGSTAAFSKFASKDSQKKTKEKLIYDFIDEAMDHGFTVEQTCSNHKIDEIEMEFNDSNVIQNFNISFKKTDSNKNPFYLMINDALDAQHLLELSWLFDRASELVSNLRGKEKALKEMGAQK